MRVATNKWLGENEAKLREYAKTLQARNAENVFDEKEYYVYMMSKVFLHGLATKGFIDRGDQYLSKVAWQEGLNMLSLQGKYRFEVNVSRMPEIHDDAIQAES